MATRIGPGKRLIVLGAGLSGLSFTHYLRNFSAFYNKTGHVSKIILLEANDYMGGSVKTQVHEDGVVHELGPRTIRYYGIKGNNTGALIEQIGLADKVVTVKKASEAGQTRFVYRNGRLHEVPGSLMHIFRRLPGENVRVISTLIKDYKTPRMDLTQYEYGDPPLYEFVKYRFGQAVAESLVDPLLRGVVAGDGRNLSTRAFVGEVLEAEQCHGSYMKSIGKPPLVKHTHDELYPNDIMNSKLLDRFKREQARSFTIETGLQTIPEHLSNSLLNTNEDGVVSIYNKTRVDSIQFNDDPDKSPCSVVVGTIDGDKVEIDGDHIISTIGSKDLAKILPERHRRDLSYISEIDHAPVACVGLEYRNYDRMPSATKSFGFLTHSKAGSKVLGVSFDTMYAPELDKATGSFRMSCMMGGSWFADVFGTSDPDKVTDAQMEEIALTEVEKILGIKSEPYRVVPYLWKKGIAQYRPGHLDKLASTRRTIKELGLPLTILGQSYDGVSVNDVVWSARLAANQIVDSL